MDITIISPREATIERRGSIYRYRVTASASISCTVDDWLKCFFHLTKDGCDGPTDWPSPPQELIDEARQLLIHSSAPE
jgi:hypothetical protein